jgi:hypothetical protein
MRKKLVVLMHSANPCYLSLCLADDPNVIKNGVLINERGESWSAPNRNDPALPREKYSIGEARPININCKCGVIGVFDRYKMEHLKALVTAASEASKSNSYSR